MKVPRGNRGVTAIALLAVLALAIGALTGPVAGAAGDPLAHTAGLKKCLKKAKRIDDPKKRKKAKKRCRRKFAVISPIPLVRATLTWEATNPGGGGNINLDLWVFDANGNMARAAADTIPNTSFSPDITSNPGTETFTDLVFKSGSARNFSYGVCYQDGGSQHVIYNLDYVTADGAHHTTSEEYGSDGAFTTFNGGAPIPTNFCKAP